MSCALGEVRVAHPDGRGTSSASRSGPRPQLAPQGKRLGPFKDGAASPLLSLSLKLPNGSAGRGATCSTNAPSPQALDPRAEWMRPPSSELRGWISAAMIIHRVIQLVVILLLQLWLQFAEWKTSQ